ncbi:mitochondrial dynamin GTPase Msp1 [Malassezia yamatoensis]|uniref:dynamin GTPase n=1 Tax=Malassezia yamatoensis TaxID=253288 RepID=A0AAJ5YW24_9BASI|nr:mitochondrial dynamin GTPase Msp1 [Malassezia yamatoensis]
MSLVRRAIAMQARVAGLRRTGGYVQSSFMTTVPSLRGAALRPSMPPVAFQRQVHARAISTGSGMPKFMLRMVRLPLYGAAGVTGLYTYTNYKLDEIKGKLGGWLGSASDSASSLFDTVSSRSNDALDGARSGFNSFWARFQSNFQQARQDEEAVEKERPDSDEQPPNPDPNSNEGLLAAAAAALGASFNSGDNQQEPENPDEVPHPQPGSSEELMLLTRKLIEVRNILKSVDHDSDQLVLPSIVVIGSQSSGKSSVLESIVGHEFLPKGNNMVTRRPIELTLIHVSPGNVPDDGIVEYGEFPGTGMGKVTDFTRIQKVLYDMNMAVSREECVSDKPIELHIHSPHVPDLSLIDLPGYVQLSSMDQPEELREKIALLCNKYIQEPNIILAVCAADVDLANSPALRASRKVDPLGRRTIGVITKMDLVPAETGAGILNNNKYPLSLGYIGVICRAPEPVNHSVFSLKRSSVVQQIQEHERSYFRENAAAYQAPSHGRNAGIAPMIGTDKLRQRLMVVLEESMGSSLSGVSNLVRTELEDASYQFKVQYNDRQITAESYVTEVMDLLKQRFKMFSHNFGKPEMRLLLKNALDDKVMDILAQIYWTDGTIMQLTELGDKRRLSPSELSPEWLHKLDASTGALTKSGIGRISTQLVANTIHAQLEQLALAEPFNYHTETAERILAFGTALLKDRFTITADQVENCVKPYKYEVELDPREWEQGRKQSEALLKTELSMCNEAYERLRSAIGSRRLRGAMEYITQLEERERQRLAARIEVNDDPEALQALAQDDQNDPTRPGFNAALLSKAREARFLQDRADILKLRMAALRSRRCKGGPDQKVFCPESFLNAVADKLTYTAVMFINIELLAEFFYQFPREIDARLGYDMTKEDMLAFARQNPAIRKHIDLQERKLKLEEVMVKLQELGRMYQDKAPHRPPTQSKWRLF